MKIVVLPALAVDETKGKVAFDVLLARYITKSVTFRRLVLSNEACDGDGVSPPFTVTSPLSEQKTTTILEKRPSDVQWVPDEPRFIVTDKTGDVYLYVCPFFSRHRTKGVSSCHCDG